MTIARLRYDSWGAVDTAFVLSEALTAATQDQLEMALVGRATPRAEPNELVYLVLADSGGPSPRRVTAFRACEPQLTNEDRIQSLLEEESAALSRLGSLPEGQRLITTLRFEVETDGRVASMRVHESSGRVAVDEAAVRIMRNAEFIPARTEGITWKAWVQIPVRFEVQAPRPRDPPYLPPPDFRD